ncbi:aldo/keto reductase [Gordonia humi]|uniref:Aryl-alcohol dehydrogenase-like predicted oxidoreductase n=1 Tax=Gordonia humi TaxID=686429 RepID=A0A840EW80_9ACTN|nr:aldo/keto reductase [Gordonia humi]MBB4135932.1 aryl-alcohol dehydrogenase-like predicted oxidoreductase [Gordonia humi]
MAQTDPTAHTVALGTWAWGDSGAVGDGYFGTALDESELQDVVDSAHRNGFTLWDTAAVYGMGRSESVLARTLAKYDRADYQLSTKFTPRIAGDGDDPVADMLAQSMERLNTDYIDLYWIHNRDDVARWTPHLIPLLESGRVRRVGVSNHDLEDLKLAQRILGDAGFRVDAVQNHYSLLYRASENAGILDYCAANDIQFYSYMVLEQGALTGRFTVENPMPAGSARADAYNPALAELTELTDTLAAIGARHDASAADVATAWAIAKGTTPIVGVTRPRYIDSLVRAVAVELADDEITEIERLAAATGVDTRGGWEQPV